MVYAVTIFLSAFLLFMLQPLMGKMILPWYGGTPAVWTTCMLFFQVVLLGGYAYAHVVSSRFKPRQQAWLHVSLLGLALILMALALQRWGSPILPDGRWKPEASTAPVPHILALLLVSIGLPYLLLSATSPLLQQWYAQRGFGEKTYRLYAVSNVGSLLGLLSYPFFTERYLKLSAQASVWAVAFAIFAVCCAIIALQLRKLDPSSRGASAAEVPDLSARLAPLTVLMWLLLAMSTSALLLAVTNDLCQEVAAVPFLWILPLSLYLVTFIICFDRPQWYQRRFFVASTAILTLVVMITSTLGIELSISSHVIAYGLFLFLFCMTCHGELVGLKPSSRHLTLFYLVIALGGALGGVFVGILSPLLFSYYWEFNIMATVAWVVVAIILLRDKSSMFHRGDWLHAGLFIWFVLFSAMRALLVFSESLSTSGWNRSLIYPAVLTLPVALLVVWPWRRSRIAGHWFWPRLLVGTVIFLAESFMVARVRQSSDSVIVADRNFYGTLRVSLYPAQDHETPPVVRLTHGRINHGIQYLDEDLRYQPVSYYGEGSGVHTAITRHPRRVIRPGKDAESLRIGVLGLGAGTIAAYAQPDDEVVFYEINPVVIDYSTRAKPYFNYISDCKGETVIVPGDARLSLERELEQGAPRQFDVLVMDAFSSDSIPVHLLTEEAFKLYKSHLRDEDSIIAVNISNRFLDLRDLIATQADHADLLPLYAPIASKPPIRTSSVWMLMTRSESFLANPTVRESSGPWKPRKEIAWTDSYSNLFSVLK